MRCYIKVSFCLLLVVLIGLSQHFAHADEKGFSVKLHTHGDQQYIVHNFENDTHLSFKAFEAECTVPLRIGHPNTRNCATDMSVALDERFF